jgi:hypothetical protein
MTYTYLCKSNLPTNHGEFEFEHSINEKLEFCPHCQELGFPNEPVTRLISSGNSFILLGGGWARDNYSK